MADIPLEKQKSLFLAAIEISSPEERAVFLDEHCGQNEALRVEVSALLQAHEGSGDLLDVPDAPESTQDRTDDCEQLGTKIGRYKLLQKIGEGGFGVVYMAEQQEPVRRKVALKIVKPGMDTKEVIARFEAEQQALAMMDHPHIARVFDAGCNGSPTPLFCYGTRERNSRYRLL